MPETTEGLTSRPLDLSEEALLASDDESNGRQDKSSSTSSPSEANLAQFMEDLSIQRSKVAASPPSPAASPVPFGPVGFSSSPVPSSSSNPQAAPPTSVRGRGNSREIRGSGRTRRHGRRGRPPAPRLSVASSKPSRPGGPAPLSKETPADYTNYLIDFHPWARYVNPVQTTW
ncbi:hypothetical protein GCK32_000323 [Trichostrongylus colubriformis]|uniref:Uncharacterized protein n=1 Tax=Trichostrongylus colubriformis TaxID=6319 RepID=A0AAN8IXY3_TRICO